MNDTSRPPFRHQKMLWLALAALAVLATVFRSLALFLHLDEIGYFQQGAVTVTLFYAVIALTALICFSFFFLINKEDVAKEPETLPSARLAGAVVAALSLGTTAVFLLLRAKTLSAPLPLVLATAVFLLCGTVYFLLRLRGTKPDAAALCGYGAILSTALSLILTYFDRYTQMNAPHKLSFHICMLLAMIALFLEMRDLLKRPLPRLCVAFTAFAAVFCLSSSIPNLLAFLGGVYDDPLYLFFDLMTLGPGVYFTTKCACYALCCSKEVAK